MNSLKYLALCLTFVLLSACGSAPVKPEAVAVKADSLIAKDFVNTMVQIETLAPWSTVLQFDANQANHITRASQSDRAAANFGQALRSAAEGVGYAIQSVDGVRGANFVRFSITDMANTGDDGMFTYDVSVGDVDFRRVYRSGSDGHVQPHKAMLVRGADASSLESDDSIFRKPTGRQTAPPLVAENQAPQTRDGFDSPFARKDQQRRLANEARERDLAVTSPTVSPPKLIDQQAPPQDAVAVTNDSVEKPVGNIDINRFNSIGKRNIAESGHSNYDSLLASTQNVAEEVLIFGDDSYVLGARNKKILGEVMGSFNPATDVISVVGCSTGTTKIHNGNAALAIGRANRVKEALLYSGIPHDKIFDEGCWSPTANSTPFPNRGVVVTVKRGITNG